jgi:hypothetical protein
VKDIQIILAGIIGGLILAGLIIPDCRMGKILEFIGPKCAIMFLLIIAYWIAWVLWPSNKEK